MNKDYISSWIIDSAKWINCLMCTWDKKWKIFKSAKIKVSQHVILYWPILSKYVWI